MNHSHCSNLPLLFMCSLFQFWLQICRCILQYFHMKRPLLLKQNRLVVNIKPTPNILPKKEERVLLPPIGPGQEMLQTLNMVMLRMETFREQHPGAVAQLIGQCLQAVRAHLAKPEEEWGARSQDLNVKRKDVQKIQGRKPLEKTRPGKLEQLRLRNEGDVVAILRGRVAELQQNCQLLGQRVNQLSRQLKQKEEELQTSKKIAEKTQKLTNQNEKLSHRLSNELEDVAKRQSEWNQTVKQLRERCKIKQDQLNVREQQISSIWQAYFSSKTCLL